ncbi:TIGR02301 family protein [Affinirhizobium pseudoryzae]|jgi:uncharacterized protein (TIGR02301 family)|uniref:TIGR02301 family protein n=1 Tax=Allorhizobium pseudoryzae TaxID=379684 RepID=UPI0013EC5B03|nr:TIGR02301 family protein [Allorhizobium pseudoryzae]
MPPIARASVLLLLTLFTAPAVAQKQSPAPATGPAVTIPAEEKPAPYDAQLLRLAEILGSVHYLRTLCGADSADWRTSMQTLLDAETLNEPKRREKLTASFNRGYRAFAGVHTTCTPAARQAEERYRNEGATLAAEIATRYGN